jgi:hypothetical protein
MRHNQKSVVTGLVAALGLGVAGTAQAQSDHVKNCIAAWVSSCSADCTTARCVSACTTQAHAVCEQNITQPQNVFSGPVVSTPLDPSECPSNDGVLACQLPLTAAAQSTCSSVAGTVADSTLCGGQVSIYVICPAGAPVGNPHEGTTTTIIGVGQSDPATCKFDFVATTVCGGAPTGCFGLIGVTSPIVGDPGWSPCTGDACPSPRPK